MGYSPDFDSRRYDGVRSGMQASGRLPARDITEEKRKKIEARRSAEANRLYATRPTELAKSLRLTKGVDLSEGQAPQLGRVSWDARYPIGAGDFGIVLRGDYSEQEAAVKVYLPEKRTWDRLPHDPEERYAALRQLADSEWQILDKNIPGVIKGIGTGDLALSEGVRMPYVVREFAPYTAESVLADIVKRDDRLEIAKRAVGQLADTLHILTDNGFLLTDLALDNILVDRSGNFLIGDVGEAYRVHGGQPTVLMNSVTGIPRYPYTPPEFDGLSIVMPKAENITEGASRSQVYSLAALSYVMLGGQMPDQVDWFLHKEYSDIERLGLPKGVVETLRKALSREPQDRFDTPGEFAEALQASV